MPNWTLRGSDQLRAAIATGALLACLCAAARLLCPWLFFTDDAQAQYLPGYIEVGKLVLSGHLPIITASMWNGGALLPEYQYGIFNPLILLLSVLVAQCHSLTIAPLIFVLPQIFFVGLAMHFAGATLRIPAAGCRLAAILVGLSSFFLFWYSSTWLPGLASFPWFVLAWIACHRLAFQNGRAVWWSLALLGLGTAGWPYFLLAIAIVAGVYFLLCGGSVRWRIAGGAIVGLLLCAPAILPVLEYASYSQRSSYTSFDDMWRVSWDAILTAFAPLGPALWQRFDWVYDRASRPIAYFNVFALFLAPLVVSVTRRRWKSDAELRLLIILSAVFLLVVGIPLPSMWRWPFRFLPIAFVFLALLCVRVLFDEGTERISWKASFWMAVIGSALLVQQPQPLNQLLYNLAAVWGAFIVISASSRGGPQKCARLLVLYSAFLLAAQSYYYRARVPSVTWSMDTRIWSYASSDFSAGLFDLSDVYLPGAWNFGVMGSAGRINGTPTLSGYSPFGLKWAAPVLFSSPNTGHLAGNQVGAIESLLRVPGACGKRWLDLIGIERLVVFPSHQASVAAHLAAFSSWTRVDEDGVWTFTRPHKKRRSLIACRTAISELKVLSASNRNLKFSVRASGDAPGTLYLRRLWVPGYQARLNGEPIEVRDYGGVLVSVTIPQGGTGELVVSYWPKSLRLGLFAAAGGFVLLITSLWLPVFARRRSSASVAVRSGARGALAEAS